VNSRRASQVGRSIGHANIQKIATMQEACATPDSQPLTGIANDPIGNPSQNNVPSFS